MTAPATSPQSNAVARSMTRPWERRREPLPSWTNPLGFRLYLAAVFFLPVQLDLGAVEAAISSRFSPSDLLLAMSLIVAPLSIRFSRRPVELLPVALVLTLTYGVVIALILEGVVTDHALLVKLFGGFVLALFGLVTAAYARAGFTLRIVRTFLLGVSISSVLAWIDWELFDVLPFLDPNVESRFGGMVDDPNNAGALFIIPVMLTWHVGTQVFKNGWARWLVLVISGLSLALSYSRGGYIGFAAAVVVVAIVSKLSVDRFVRFIGVALVLVPMIYTTGLVDSAIGDFNRRPDNVGAREELASDGIDFFVDSHGLGAGLGTYKAAIDEIIHNTALWLFVEMSIVGLLLFIAVSVVPMRAYVTGLTVNRGLALGLLGGHVGMVVTSVGIEAIYQRHWWLIIGLASFAYVSSTWTVAEPATSG